MKNLANAVTFRLFTSSPFEVL